MIYSVYKFSAVKEYTKVTYEALQRFRVMAPWDMVSADAFVVETNNIVQDLVRTIIKTLHQRHINSHIASSLRLLALYFIYLYIDVLVFPQAERIPVIFRSVRRILRSSISRSPWSLAVGT